MNTFTITCEDKQVFTVLSETEVVGQAHKSLASQNSTVEIQETV